MALNYGAMGMIQQHITALGNTCPKATELLQHAHGLLQRTLSALDAALLAPPVVVTPQPLSKPALVPATTISGGDMMDALSGVTGTPSVMAHVPVVVVPPTPSPAPAPAPAEKTPAPAAAKSSKPTRAQDTAARQLCRLDVATFAAMLLAHGIDPNAAKWHAALQLAMKGVKAADAKKPAKDAKPSDPKPAPSVANKTPAPSVAAKSMEINVEGMTHDTLKGIAVCLKPSVLRTIVSSLPEAQLRDIIAKLAEKELVAATKLHVKNLRS